MLDIAGLVPTTAATVTERWDPAARHQKPTNRLDWWKGKFVLFQMLATGVGRAVICPKADSPYPAKQRVRAFIGEGFYRQKQHSQL